MITGIPQLNLARSSDRGHQSANRTRQGYARKRILKPAGHFFPATFADMGFPSDWQQQPLWQEVNP
jgi:hypothetical protein